MKKLFLLLPTLMLCLVALVVASASVPRMMLRPTLPDADGSPKPLEAFQLPRAVVDEATFHFGMMDPLTVGQHTFTIRNVGEAPLELQAGATTCKCTLSEITQDVIVPGASGQVRLTWNTGSKHAFYSHGATVHTNDPLAKEIDLRIQGNVRVLLGTDPESVVLERVEPDREAHASFCVFSEIWETFEVASVRCSVEGSRWEIAAADPKVLEPLQARSGYRIQIMLPAGMPDGFFNELVTLDVQPPEGFPEEQEEVQPENDRPANIVEVPLNGKVLRRLSVYGKGMDHLGTVDLGILKRGQGLQRRLLLKLRDPEPRMEIGEIRVKPEFVKARVTGGSPLGEAKGLYHLDLEIPASAPVCAYRGAERGALHLSIEHPRVEALSLSLRFAIVESR